MRLSRATFCILAAWLVLVGGYGVVAQLMRPGTGLSTFGDIAQCLVPLFANAGLLLNAASPNWRKNTFWMLLALGCSLWMVGQLIWTYAELYLREPIPNVFVGQCIFFLHTVPMIAALALPPDQAESENNLRYGYLDFTLLLSWWVYLFLFVVVPWQYVVRDKAIYTGNYSMLYTVENIIFLIGIGALLIRAPRNWRFVYANLFGAASLYTLGDFLMRNAIREGKYYTGSVYDLPVVASLVWFGTAGIVAYWLCPSERKFATPGSAVPAAAQHRRHEGVWPSWMAMIAVLSLPVLALWCVTNDATPAAVRQFRLLVTLCAILPLSSLVFLRQHLVDADRLRLLNASQESLENLRRLQTQFVQAEKLASLGQLAAGAAHEINNPLTAILGYSDLLIDDETAGEKPRSIAAKIRDQARRTKTLVTNLLSFARQVPAERTLLDVNTIVTSAVQLRKLDLRGKNINIELHTESVLPGVRGDANQLLQVFFNIINNAVDAMEEVGGGVLTVRTAREYSSVVIQFSDTGPGIREPQLVFDPFYTTKPVGKGTGLGLSICYGLVHEHGGRISGYNRPEGGATFRIELPAVLALFPGRENPPTKEPKGTETPSPQTAGKP